HPSSDAGAAGSGASRRRVRHGVGPPGGRARPPPAAHRARARSAGTDLLAVGPVVRGGPLRARVSPHRRSDPGPRPAPGSARLLRRRDRRAPRARARPGPRPPARPAPHPTPQYLIDIPFAPDLVIGSVRVSWHSLFSLIGSAASILIAARLSRRLIPDER